MIWPMEWLKTVGGKVASGIVVLAVFIAGLAWFQADPAWRANVVNSIGKSIGWLAAVIVLPWAAFALIGWVARQQSNLAGACLVAGLTIVEAVTLLWLFDFSLSGGAAWAMFIAAILIAGVYNTLACDWIAERVEG